MNIAPATASYAAPPAAVAANSRSTATPNARGEAEAGQDALQNPDIQREIARLADRDREVRAHEQAHQAAGGSLITSGPNFSYTTGPDRKRYATGGEVGIDTSPVRDDPEATIIKARQIRAAALAPAEPSSQDRQVAAKASAMEQSARLELVQQQREQAYASTAAGAQQTRGLQVAEFA